MSESPVFAPIFSFNDIIDENIKLKNYIEETKISTQTIINCNKSLSDRILKVAGASNNFINKNAQLREENKELKTINEYLTSVNRFYREKIDTMEAANILLSFKN